MPSFYPEGNVPIQFDQEQRSLQKIVSLLQGGAGGGGGGSSVTVGNGPPVAAGTSGSIYWDEIGKNQYIYDVDGWNIH
jgi:hypothetical protein